MRSAAGIALALAVVTAGCTQDKLTGFSTSLASCAAGLAPVTLAAGSYASYDPAASGGCIAFAANASATDTAEYLLVALSAGGSPGDSAPFTFRSATAPGITPALAAGATPLPARASAAVTFDRFLRGLARNPRALGVARISAAFTAPAAGPPQRVARPVVGARRLFTVCSKMDCSAFRTVVATARSVGTHLAIFVDSLAPAGGLGAADLDSLQQTFDTHGYAIDTTAFGRESDLDSNGVVIVLLTGVVNALVTTAVCDTSGFVNGFFFAPDIDPSTAASYNHGEIFYALVPDPLGTLSCAHSVAEVKQDLPPTFLHEFEHMINYTQHVLVHGASPEDTWLDEGLAKYAEELGGRSWLPEDSAQFSSYLFGDVYNAGQYLLAPEKHALLTSGDMDLPDVGAGWLFVRYVVDQFGAGITARLVQTGLTGTDNVAGQTGQAFAGTAARWALANWVSDLPTFSAPPELRYSSWHFRRTFAGLNSQDPADFPRAFPLAPSVASAATAVNLTGYLRAGSGAYVRVLQAPGAAGLALALNAGLSPVPATLSPRFTVIRIR